MLLSERFGVIGNALDWSRLESAKAAPPVIRRARAMGSGFRRISRAQFSSFLHTWQKGKKRFRSWNFGGTGEDSAWANLQSRQGPSTEMQRVCKHKEREAVEFSLPRFDADAVTGSWA